MILELCMAVAIFFEARDQPIDGQRAVAEVIMNRVADPQWPDTICEVVNQPKQFSFTHDGKSDNPTRYRGHGEEKAWRRAKAIAESTAAGRHLLGISSTHYHSTSVRPAWRHKLKRDGRIGDHIFYSK